MHSNRSAHLVVNLLHANLSRSHVPTACSEVTHARLAKAREDRESRREHVREITRTLYELTCEPNMIDIARILVEN
jgi:hypothetical protein